jgi:hypothetical protein
MGSPTKQKKNITMGKKKKNNPLLGGEEEDDELSPNSEDEFLPEVAIPSPPSSETQKQLMHNLLNNPLHKTSHAIEFEIEMDYDGGDESSTNNPSHNNAFEMKDMNPPQQQPYSLTLTELPNYRNPGYCNGVFCKPRRRKSNNKRSWWNKCNNLKDSPLFSCFGDHHNEIISWFCGFLFGVGWWLMIDATVYTSHTILPDPEHPEWWMGTPLWWFYVPAIFSSLGFFMLNVVKMEEAWGSSEYDDTGRPCGRPWLFISFIIFFAGLISAFWIFFARFIYGGNFIGPVPTQKWLGTALLLQNILIASSSLIQRFYRRDEG